jgi:hypothetical protein
MTAGYFKEADVNWAVIPTLQELERHIAGTLGVTEVEVKPTMRLKKLPLFSLNSEEYVTHKQRTAHAVISMYEENGFETRRILQDPFGHIGPTVACPIGFPFNLPNPSFHLRKFNRWICRVHVEVASSNDTLISVPHLEPDPRFQPLAHLWDTYIKKRVVRGREAVAVLSFLGIR